MGAQLSAIQDNASVLTVFRASEPAASNRLTGGPHEMARGQRQECVYAD